MRGLRILRVLLYRLKKNILKRGLMGLKVLWHWLKKNIFKVVCWLSVILLVYLILITLIDLSKYPVDFFSKDSIKRFFDAFEWCRIYIAACFVLYPIYYTVNTYKLNEENKIYNNIVKPRTEALNSRLKRIELENLKMFEHFDHHGKQIIEDIIYNEKDARCIKSQEKLKKYFAIHIEKHIQNFEYCGYNYGGCKNKICTGSACDKSQPTHCAKKSHSLKEFKAIAYELFCISNYAEFYDDIEKLYKDNIEKIFSVTL